MLLRKKLGFLLDKAGQIQVSIQPLRHARRYGKMSRLYCPVNVTPPTTKQKAPPTSKKDQLSKSQRLMLDNGLIQLSSTNGTYHLLPIATKSLDKLVRIIEMFMEKADCQKIRMPILASSKLWSATGRLDNFGPELMMLKDRHDHSLVLCPTHEEVICGLLSLQPLSRRSLPLRLYQVTEKFRDEKRPRFGLLRGREFLMKDLYTFDPDESSAETTYNEINNIYAELFNYMGLKFAKVEGSTGLMGGNRSHEFHLVSEVGEDKIVLCNDCQSGYNQEIQVPEQTLQEQPVAGSPRTKTVHQPPRTKNLQCAKCKSTNVTASSAIEIGHSFLLGTKYTEPFHTSFHAPESSSQSVLYMGCYGIGVTRLLASVVEVMSTQEEIRWPLPIAPYMLAFLPPKEGSKEEQSPGMKLAEKLHSFLIDLLPKDVLIDDRTDLTIGRRLKDMKKLGIPYTVVCGKQLRDEVPKIELIDVYSGSTTLLDIRTAFRHLYDLKNSWTFL